MFPTLASIVISCYKPLVVSCSQLTRWGLPWSIEATVSRPARSVSIEEVKEPDCSSSETSVVVSRFFLCFMLAIWFKPLINNVFRLYHKYINSVCVWIKSVATQILVAGKDHKDVEYDDDSDHLSSHGGLALGGNDDDDRMILRLLLWRLYSCYYTLPSQWGQGGQRGLTLGGNDNDDRMILRL